MKRTQFSNVLVTGSAGFIGSYLVRELKSIGHTVTGVDNMILGSNYSTTNYVSDAANLSVMRKIMQRNKPQVVFLLAAVPCESFSAFAPNLISYNTYMSTIASLTAAIEAGVKRVVYISSMAVYGHGKPPFDEKQVPSPADIYGIAKFASELAVQNMCEAYNVEWVILRPHNVYGPGQRLDDALRNVVGIFLNSVMAQKPMPIYGDGMQQRSFSYIDDVINAIVKAGYTNNISRQVINIGTDVSTTILQLAKVVGKVTGFANVVYYKSRREVKIATTTNSKAKKLLGYKDSVSLEVGIKRMYAWACKQGPKHPIYLKPELRPEWMPDTWKNKKM